MNRKDVYKIIDGERDYQIKRHKNHPVKHKDVNHSVADWVIYMENQLNKAKEHIYNLDTASALEQVRKVTALGVACMELNETKYRGSYE